MNPSVSDLEPASDAAFAGHLDIEAAVRTDGRTALVRQSFRAPFHISKPYWDGRVLQVRIINPTAGILAGDRLDLVAKSLVGAALLVAAPAAARAFMMLGGAAVCRQTFVVEPGAWLEYASEPLFPHGGSDYDQSTRIEVAHGGELYFADSLAPGRAGRGEIWAWRRLQLALNVTCGGDCALRERFAGAGADLGRLAAFYAMPEAWFGTVVVISPQIKPDDDAWEKIRSLHGGGRWVGVTRLRPGAWIVRLVAPGSQALRDGLAEVRTSLAKTLPALASDLRRV